MRTVAYCSRIRPPESGTEQGPSNGGGGTGSSAGGPDRLSALPDCLLHTIMSSLKARQVVQTCVLSTRWRHVWCSVPCLDIDIVEFWTKVVAHASSSGIGDSSSDSNSESDNYYKDKREGWDEFEDFTVNLMLHCNIALLDSFRLDIDRGWGPQSYGCSDSAKQGWEYSGRQAAAWLRCAMKYCTPGSGHAISQRQGLKLSPSSWRLRRLHLCHVPLDDRFVEHLSSVCRCLEDLELDHCICEICEIASDSLKNLVLKSCSWGAHFSHIASPTLKSLVIDGSYKSGGYDDLVAISAPMVAYLRLNVDVGGFWGGISINKMPSLDRASIHLGRHIYSYSKLLYGSKLGGDQSKLLCSLYNVTSLELSGVGRMVLGEEPAFQEFQKLRNLQLSDCDFSDDFRILRFFHRGSPNLEKVTLRHCKFPGDSEDKKGTPKLDKTSSCGCCCGLDFLRDENIKLEIIHKDGDACRSAEELVHDLPDHKVTIDAVPDAATTTATEDLMPHTIGVGPRRGARHRMTSVRISGPEWERPM